MRRKVKKSTKKFLRNKKLRTGKMRQKKLSQRIRREMEIKRERLRRRKDIVDDEEIEKKKIKQHLSLLTERSEEIEFTPNYDPRGELERILNNDLSVFPPVWSGEMDSSTRLQNPSNSKEVPTVVRGLHDSSVAWKEKIVILSNLSRYYGNTFNRTRNENSTNLMEYYRVIADKTKEYKEEKSNLLLLFRVILSFFQNETILLSLAPGEVHGLFNQIRDLLPFFGRISLKETQQFSKYLFLCLLRILDLEPKEEPEKQKQKFFTEKIFNLIFVTSSFYPFPHLQDNLRYWYLLCLIFGEFEILDEMFLRLSCIEFDVTATQIYDMLNWTKLQLKKNATNNFPFVLKSVLLVGTVLKETRTQEFEVLIQPFFACVSGTLNIQAPVRGILGVVICVMKVWGESQIVLHFPLLPHLIGELRSCIRSVEETVKVVKLIEEYVLCFWNVISFEETMFLLTSELEKNTYQGIPSIKKLMGLIKSRTKVLYQNRENLEFGVAERKQVEKFEWEMANDSATGKRKRVDFERQDTEGDEDEMNRPKKKRKVE